MTRYTKSRRPGRCGTLLLSLLSAILMLAPSFRTARAGGIWRPNTAGARPVGLAGAYCAVANDAWSIPLNPHVDLICSLDPHFPLAIHGDEARLMDQFDFLS